MPQLHKHFTVSSNHSKPLSNLSRLIPTEIRYLLDNYEEDDSNLQIIKADFSGDFPVINFTLNQSDKVSQSWNLQVIGHRASLLHFNLIQYYSTIQITDDHPLLWEYSDIQGELYFRGTASNVSKLITELNQIDYNLFGRYLNSTVHLENLFRTTNGLLAKGARQLLSKYADCLKSHDILPNIIGERIPTFWDGKNHISAKDLKIFIIEDSYIIGNEFLFEQAVK